MSDENKFDKGDPRAHNTQIVEADCLKPDSHIIMKDQRPCKVTAFSNGKSVKHESNNTIITAKDILTNKQSDETDVICDTIPRPIINKTDLKCKNANEDGVLGILTGDGKENSDLNMSSLKKQTQHLELPKLSENTYHHQPKI